jgi:hypothetical protein
MSTVLSKDKTASKAKGYIQSVSLPQEGAENVDFLGAL